MRVLTSVRQARPLVMYPEFLWLVFQQQVSAFSSLASAWVEAAAEAAEMPERRMDCPDRVCALRLSERRMIFVVCGRRPVADACRPCLRRVLPGLGVPRLPVSLVELVVVRDADVGQDGLPGEL